ncbi:MAG: 3-isopropylmalate dehydratase small subunit [Rickettsiales bacterium]|nr:3-isopropylmalate dehydratase small subunit [Rickettsiales bacterium]
MQAFKHITAVAASLPVDNVDTDMIIPKQFLKTIKRTGLSEGLFYEMRYDVEGNKNPDFVLHKEPYSHAEIIVSGDNFGCGSSREHAPWALLDFGIRCVIAESFADIFYNNCFKNGILPVQLPKEQVAELRDVATSENPEITVDLENQTIRAHNKEYAFDVDASRKHNLLNGLDDIGLSLQHVEDISAYEASRAQHTPWLF